VMGDNYAEIYDQIFECPDAAWYLTANDDAGGGTYQVIEALRGLVDAIPAARMRAMNLSVDRDGRSPGDVAREFLDGVGR